jgi:transcriptional antiterminator NusG
MSEETKPENTEEEVKEEKMEEETVEEKPEKMSEPKLSDKKEKQKQETEPADVSESEELVKELLGKKEEPEEPAEPEKPEEKPEDKPAELSDKKEEAEEEKKTTTIYALRTTANREDQVMDFVTSNITRKGLGVSSVIRAHGMRGYIFLEAESRVDAEQAAYGIPYARGILPSEIDYSEMEHMIEPMKRELNIKKNDIVEIISGPFKRETAKITRIDEQKEEVVVELVEAAVPIPITLKIDAVKVIRRETDEKE